jgi:hypothetical protein
MAHPARSVFDRLERLAGNPLEKLTNSPDSPYVMMAIGRAWVFGIRRLEALRSAIVHTYALPSHRDLRRLSAQVARLQRAVEEIEQSIADGRDGPP